MSCKRPAWLSRNCLELLGDLDSQFTGRIHQESTADLELSAFLTDQGWPTTSRRVREWRAVGLIPPSFLVRQGYAQPVLATNQPGTFERALVVAKAYGGKRIRLEWVALRLFARGEQVDEQLLRKALVAAVDYVVSFAARKAKSARIEDQVDVLVTWALEHDSKEVTFLRKGAKDNTKGAPSAVASSVLELMFTAFLGGDIRAFALPGIDGDSALDELLAATRAIGLAEDVIEGIGAIVEGGVARLRDDILSSLEISSADNLRRLALLAPLPDILWARDEFLPAAGVAKDVATNIRLLGGPKNAFGMAAGRLLRGDEQFVGLHCLLLLAQAEYKGKEGFESGIGRLRELAEKLSSPA